MKKINPDLVHFQFASGAAQFGELAKSLGYPFTFSIRGADIQNQPYLIDGYLDNLKKACFNANGIHSVCDSLKNELFSLVPDLEKEKVRTIYTAISDDWTAPTLQSGESRIWLSVGRLHWRKGFDTLILAYDILKRSNTDGLRDLIIVGEGDEREKLQYMINDLKLSKHIHLVGKKDRKEILSFFARTDLYIQSSLFEGFPNSLAEAWKCGIPSVSTNINGVPELWPKEFSHLLSEAGNGSDLAEKISQTMRLVADGKFDVRKFKAQADSILSKEVHARKFNEFWNSALS